MTSETPQRIHRQDYTPPPFLVDSVELDVHFNAGEVLVNSQLQLRRNPLAALAAEAEQRPCRRYNSTARGWKRSP
ncbi:MAG: hypothetical protein V5B30_12410 [Candidatus Accumulibacter delftensis]|jgi:aminopeptidase N